MSKLATALMLLLASLLILPLAACSTPTIGLTDAKAIAQAIGHVAPSKADTCDTQAALAAQSSRIDTIVAGTEKVYKPVPCSAPPPAAAAKTPSPPPKPVAQRSAPAPPAAARKDPPAVDADRARNTG